MKIDWRSRKFRTIAYGLGILLLIWLFSVLTSRTCGGGTEHLCWTLAKCNKSNGYTAPNGTCESVFHPATWTF
jgi:hypothetical protein